MRKSSQNHPQNSVQYHCGDDFFETLMRDYDKYFSRKYDFWRPYTIKVTIGYFRFNAILKKLYLQLKSFVKAYLY